MSLKDYQRQVTLSVLYECTILGGVSGERDQLRPNLFVNSGTVDVYGSNSATQPVSLAHMALNTENTGVGPGVLYFGVIPRWLCVVQKSGTSSDVVTTALSITSKGNLAATT